MGALKKAIRFVEERLYRADREGHRRALSWLARRLISNAGTLIILGLFLLAQSVGAGPSAAPLTQGATKTLLSYQGTLTDKSGDPINGNVDMVFALYHQAEGGTAFWTESYTGANAVEVKDGQFHVLLGSQVALDPTDLTGDLYLGITINDEEMLPREQLVSVVDAVNAERAPGNFTIASKLTMGGNIDMQAHNLQNVNDITSGDPDGGGWGAENFQITNSYGNIRLRAAGGMYLFIDTDNSGTDATFMVLKDNDSINPPATVLFWVAENGDGNFARNLVLNDGREIYWTDNGQIRCLDDSHRIVFDRSHNELEIREFGQIYLHAGGTNGGDADLVVSDSQIDVRGNSVVNCGALTEANLQTPEELAADRIDRFSEGDVLCWSPESDRLERCTVASDPLVQAVADADGRPIVIGAEVVKVLGPVQAGDILVASDVPGYAMVNNDPRPGIVIAQALEDFDGEQGLVKAMIRKF